MPQYTVPQFIDMEPKIFGPITLRQFIIMVITLLLDFIIYRIFLSVIGIIVVALPLTGIALIVAFGKVNGRPMHLFLLNVIRTLRRPSLRVWSKELSNKEIKEFMAKVPEEHVETEVIPTKNPISSSKLMELSLIVNTGGIYHPDDLDNIESATVKQPELPGSKEAPKK